MGARPAADWRRLAPLTGAVLGAHLAVLQWTPATIVRPSVKRVAFTTRAIAQAEAPPTAPAELPPRPDRAFSPPSLPGEGRVEGQADRPSAPRERHAAPAPAPRPKPAGPARRIAAQGPHPPPAAPLATEPKTAIAAPPRSAAPVEAPAPSGAAPFSITADAPVSVLPSMHLQYTIEVRTHGFRLSGRAELDWRHDAAAYAARLEMRSFGLPARIQRSEGRITPQGLAPSYFSDKARNEQAVHFDREHERLVFSNNRPDAPIAAGMQDRLSVVLQLAALIAGDPARYPPGTQITVPTASARDAEDWVFAVAGEEDLDLPGGRERALKLERLPRKEYDQQVELWLAPRRDYAPLRLRLTNPNGDAADLRWSSTDRP